MTRLAEGLLVGHLFLLTAYVAGAAIFPVRDGEIGANAAQALVRFTATTGIGIAVLGFTALALALVGLLTPLPLILTPPALVIGASLVFRESPLSASYWRARASVLWQAWNEPTFVVYFAALILSEPAVLPNVGGDPVHYHLAYAQDWATTGRLSIDPLLRFPFYASNFLVILASAIVLKAATALNFITWAALLLTALTVYACSRDAFDRAAPRIWNSATAAFLAIAVVASPVYWRWAVTAYMDVPIAALVLTALVCLQLAAAAREARWLFGSAVVAAFFVGCKPSFLLLLPFFAAAIAYIGFRIRVPLRSIAASILLLGCLSAPWYVRNLTLTGDPIPPVLNLALHGYDGFIDKSEWTGIKEDLGTDKSAAAFVTLPFRAFSEPLSMDFREYGAPALILLLFAPPLFLLISFSVGRRTDPIALVFVGMLCILIAYWFGVSSLLRYALIFLPVLAVSAAFCAAPLLRWRPQFAFVLTIAAALTAIPTPASNTWYMERFRNNYRYASDVYTSDDAFLRANNDGYAEEQFAVRELRKRSLDGVVYIMGGATEYWFRRDGFQTAGDWVGPAGWYRLYHAIDAHRAVEFLRDLGADAVLLDRSFVLGGLEIPLSQQLTTGGFERVAIPDSRYELFVERRSI